MVQKTKPKEFQCEVKHFQYITPTVFEIDFTVPEPLTFLAGQFISIVIPGGAAGGRDLRRAYSIASEPEANPVKLCIKLVEGGPGTTYLNKLRPGDRFRGFAPYGDFVYKTKNGRAACFLSTGTGIAPFRSMIRSKAFAENPPPKAWCLLGVREEDEILYDAEMSANRLVQWQTTVSRPTSTAWKGYKGRITDYLRSIENTIPWAETDFYLCGNGAMIDEMKALFLSKGVAKEAIHQEVYYRPKEEEKTG